MTSWDVMKKRGTTNACIMQNLNRLAYSCIEGCRQGGLHRLRSVFAAVLPSGARWGERGGALLEIVHVRCPKKTAALKIEAQSGNRQEPEDPLRKKSAVFLCGPDARRSSRPASESGLVFNDMG